MKKTRYTESQIFQILKEAEAGMQASDMARLKDLETENRRFKDNVRRVKNG